MVRQEPTSGRDLANGTQNTADTTRDTRQTEVRSEVFILHGVVTVTFRVLSWFVVTMSYSYSKIVLQLTVVPPAKYPINRFI
jgi:hypothetical protein